MNKKCKNKKVFLTYSKERVILSDVLPYETPLIFSNRYFYAYLQSYPKNKKSVVSKINEILLKLTPMPPNKPFKFYIKHKENDFRQLTIIHPYYQYEMIEFYEKYKNLILYFSSISPFSIRKASKVARFSFYNDTLHKKNENKDLEYSQIEQDDCEYENLRSYFTYKKYNNIHKFYESYNFHRCEKKYNHLKKIDIAKCFDSIYSHSLSWALYNKDIIKDNIKKSKNSFAGKFDQLMMALNEGETNGIVIGPEFSRIFAELLLQEIDKNIYINLEKKQLIHKKDYEIFRYIDDSFIFYNNEKDIQCIIAEYRLAYKEYKLYLNDSKSIIYNKPIITKISIAKQKISDLFNQNLEIKENTQDQIYFSSNQTITKFKTIIQETNVSYNEIMNYSLAILDNKTKKLINKFLESQDNKTANIEQTFENGFLEILDVSFFIYSVDPRVNSTIKICLIVSKILRFLKKNKTNDYKEPFSNNAKHTILKKIYDEIFLILQKNKSEHTIQIETLYLLITLSQLGKEYRLNPKVLCSYFNIIYNDGDTANIPPETNLNYFSIIVFLFYIKNIKQYSMILDKLKIYIYNKFDKIKNMEWNKDTEIVLLFMDILTCPYFDNYKATKITDVYEFKLSIMNLLNINSNQINLIKAQKYWFTKWDNFDFNMELEAKKSQEVY